MARLCVLGVAAGVVHADSLGTVVVGPLKGTPRPGAILEVPLRDWRGGRDLKVVDAAGKPRRSQVLDLDGDGVPERLLIEADLPARGTLRFRILAGVPEAEPALCHGRHVPERLDDYAWENDRVAFRVYGPALATAPGEVSSSGVDYWAKRVSHPVIDAWYASGDYHRDRGEGLDAYKVGTSRGCGGTGVWVDGRLAAAGVWKTQRTLAQGPLRVVFELGYGPYAAGAATVTEVKRFSLDRGSHFVRIETRVGLVGADQVTYAAGVVRRKGEAAPLQGEGWVANQEPAAAHGRIATALLAPGARIQVLPDHALALRTLSHGGTFVHWAGASWDRAGAFPDLAAWGAHVAREAEALAQDIPVRLLGASGGASGGSRVSRPQP